MDCASVLRKYSRYVLIIFNFLFVLTGVVIISVGASVKAYYHEYNSFLDAKYTYASDLLIVIGVIIFIISFFGCCGALKENACMTLTFSTLLIVIFVLEVIVGIGGILLKRQADDVINTALTKTMKEYGGNDTEITDLWDKVQTNFHCCGINNATDWDHYLNKTDGLLPLSCCTFKHGTIGNASCNLKSKALHHEGCLDAFSDYIEDHATSIESVGITLAIVQLLGIILSCYLSKAIKSDYETV